MDSAPNDTRMGVTAIYRVITYLKLMAKHEQFDHKNNLAYTSRHLHTRTPSCDIINIELYI